ncbi:hypothetical protein GGS21DRAFT_543965 [Xylaria nigripes]|nr:hypothetical protein GGS21DRAFT_543965 [Xylaria nigripes]
MASTPRKALPIFYDDAIGGDISRPFHDPIIYLVLTLRILDYWTFKHLKMTNVDSLRPNTDDMWKAALATLSDQDRATLDKLERSDRLSNITEALRLAHEARDKCQDKAWRFKRESGEEVVARDVLAKIARWVSHFKAVGDTIVQYDPVHAALPWAGFRFVLQACCDHFEVHEFLLEDMQSIANQICRCQVIEKYLQDSPSPADAAVNELKGALVRLYARILAYLAQVKAYFDNKSVKKQFLKDLLGGSQKFKSHFKDITAAQKDVHEYSQIATLQVAIARLETPLSRWNEALTKISDGLSDAERTKVLLWISKEPYEDYHNSERKDFIAGTGEWLLSHPTFRTWKDESASSLFWLHGIPGSGKSKLTSLVVKDAQNAFENKKAPPPAYFYCSRNPAEPGRSDPGAILASIVRQLSCLKPEEPLFPPTVAKYRSCEKNAFAASSLQPQETFDLLLEILTVYQTATIIIDAFDECNPETRQELLDHFESLLHEPSILLKIFVSSRNDQDIVYQLQTYPTLELSKDLISDDINRYMESEIYKLIKTRKLLGWCRDDDKKKAMRQKISLHVSAGAQGMFRWASLQLAVLCKLKSFAAIDERLGKIPPKLGELYQELLNEIQTYEAESDRCYARNSLAWLLCARRRLRSDEFLMAVSTTTDSPSEPLSKDQVLDLCRNFVVFDDNLDTFRFAHLSVREFLESQEEYAGPKVNSIAGQCCLRTLMVYNDLSQTPHLHLYARWHWHSHYQDGSVDSESPMQSLLRKFLSHREIDSPFMNWVARDYLSKLRIPGSSYKLDKNPDTLEVASVLDLVDIVESILEKDPNISDSRLQRCAAYSAMYGTGKALNALLDSKRVTVTPRLILHGACNLQSGEKVTALLLKKADKVEITQNFIEAAAWNLRYGSKMMALTIKNQKREIDIKGEKIREIAKRFNSDVMAAILDMRGNDFKITPAVVEAAAGNKSHGEEIIRLLLDERGNEFKITPAVVEAAAGNKFHGEEILRLLLDERGNDFKITPAVVEAAAGNKFHGEEILRLLLDERGDEVTITPSVVEAAAGNKFHGEEILRLLLDERGNEFKIMPAVVEAAAGNKSYGEKIIRLLLNERGDEVTITPSVVKAAAGNFRYGEKIMALLLTRNAAQPIIGIDENVSKGTASKSSRDYPIAPWTPQAILSHSLSKFLKHHFATRML